jgi:hypothetical protein
MTSLASAAAEPELARSWSPTIDLALVQSAAFLHVAAEPACTGYTLTSAAVTARRSAVLGKFL